MHSLLSDKEFLIFSSTFIRTSIIFLDISFFEFHCKNLLSYQKFYDISFFPPQICNEGQWMLG